MTANTAHIHIDRISSLLAENGFEVSEQADNILRITETASGIALRAALQGEILFFTLNCVTVRASSVTPELMRKMLAGNNGISTSGFQLYEAGDGKVSITLNNFCKLQDMGTDDEDDILSCVHFLLADVVEARRLIGGMVK
jgi:hypothetical protein